MKGAQEAAGSLRPCGGNSKGQSGPYSLGLEKGKGRGSQSMPPPKGRDKDKDKGKGKGKVRQQVLLGQHRARSPAGPSPLSGDPLRGASAFQVQPDLVPVVSVPSVPLSRPDMFSESSSWRGCRCRLRPLRLRRRPLAPPLLGSSPALVLRRSRRICSLVAGAPPHRDSPIW